MRTIYKLLICLIICLMLCSCMGDSAQAYDISAFMDSFTAMDFSAMYDCVSPAVDIDEDAFIEKYDAIFSGLGVTEIVIENLSEPDTDGVYTYTATYKTESYGDFTNDFTLQATIEDDTCVVLWDYALIFPEMEEGSHVRIETLKAERGEIFASDGSILAKNTYADTVYMNISKVEDLTDVSDIICTITDLTNTEIINMFNKALEDETEIVVLGTFFSDALTDEQKESILSVPGLGIDDEQYTPIRYYDMGESAAHIIGYMGYAGEDDEGYLASDKLGITGLEAAYETELRGS
ncbi:MAG: NTF2-like N-terminal transpeptidase domain-containing protein, partial [Eubacteriales bacterium]|nr:NTF2-like N-terminal transpeptidase domain-containing protein [Eubacteriales bacterium]